ncbi:MAG: hypothetical protein LBE44_15525, partial [Microbacterium hominis]|nr:hypothetical protein [Microbacterium hominis]
TSRISYLDENGATLPTGENPWLVPDAAVQVTGIRVEVDWSRQGWRLDDATAQLSARCTPSPQESTP